MAENNIKLKRSSVPGKVPTGSQLDLGEMAINTHDGKVFIKQDANGDISIRQIGPELAENVLYVSKSGSDNNNGDALGDSFLTLDQALSVATPGTTIYLKSGDYTIDNSSGGLDVPENVAIVGDNLRTTTIRGSVSDNDLLYVRKASYITGVTFRGHTDGAAAISFNPDGSAGEITTSPYVQNCSSITTTGTGMKIDGQYVTGLKSMVADAFTQINIGGIGVHMLNQAYAQLVSIFTVACDTGVLVESGAQCSLTNSNCSFGNFGIKSTGTSPILYSGTVDGGASFASREIVITGLTEKPKYGDAVKFSGDPNYYTIEDSTDLTIDTATITLLGTLQTEIADTTAVDFYQRSLISASSITFEYVGAGTDEYSTPRSGGYPIQANEVVQDANGAGLINSTSTDHRGDFRIGENLVINRTSSTIEGQSFDRSLFYGLIPYVLALED